MKQSGEAQEAVRPSDGTARTGQSGEGARSALEHLVQQERKREAQRPRDGGAPAPAPTPAR